MTPNPAPASSPPPGPLPLPGRLQLLAAEIATYYRELPRLIDEGQEHRVALVKGDEVSVWDTTDDALQYAVEKYGMTAFLCQPIDARDTDRLAPYMPPAGGDAA